jgi:hypothetical protein
LRFFLKEDKLCFLKGCFLKNPIGQFFASSSLALRFALRSPFQIPIGFQNPTFGRVFVFNLLRRLNSAKLRPRLSKNRRFFDKLCLSLKNFRLSKT